MPVTPATRVSVPADVLIQELEGESVLLNLQSERYFGLDEVGTRMWTNLIKSSSIEQACEALQAEYDVEPEKLRADLLELTNKLLDHGLLQIAHD